MAGSAGNRKKLSNKRSRRRTLVSLFSVAVLASILFSCPSYCSSGGASNPTIWRLAWSDEFDGPNGSPVDSTKWSFDIGGNGWGNNELETYTNRTDNAELQGGSLIIRALKESFTGPDKITRNYTSARLLTRNKFTQTYGRFEARIKIPYGQGIWPAFWMLGNDLDTAGWPSCGEIDIMEYYGDRLRANVACGTTTRWSAKWNSAARDQWGGVAGGATGPFGTSTNGSSYGFQLEAWW